MSKLRKKVSIWVEQAYVNGALDTLVEDDAKQGFEACVELVLDAVIEALPEKKPKVIQRKGVYLPYQPQVEQHKRQGYNEAIDEITAILTAAKSHGETK